MFALSTLKTWLKQFLCSHKKTHLEYAHNSVGNGVITIVFHVCSDCDDMLNITRG